MINVQGYNKQIITKQRKSCVAWWKSQAKKNNILKVVWLNLAKQKKTINIGFKYTYKIYLHKHIYTLMMKNTLIFNNE